MRRSRLNSPGFTLVELLVSIAIALLLILGVNTVFKYTAQTAGAGNSLLNAVRDGRTFMAAMLADLNQIVPADKTVASNSPCFIIHSTHEYAFRNQNDLEGANDPSPSHAQGNPRLLYPYADATLYGNTYAFPNNLAPVPYVTIRSHRVDQLGFFARGLFARQTSSDSAAAISYSTATEAWIVYGHGMQPNNNYMNTKAGTLPDPTTASWYGPGDLDISPAITSSGNNTNDSNFFAADWIMTRQAILLAPSILPAPGPAPNLTTDPDYLLDQLTPNIGMGNNKLGLTPLAGPLQGQNLPASNIKQPMPTNLVPQVAPNVNSNPTGTASYLTVANNLTPPITIDISRLDLANTSISQWSDPTRVNGIMSYAPGGANAGYDWWTPLIGYRFQVSPYLLMDPNSSILSSNSAKITPYGLAKCAPSLLRGCSQFIVEYAGNYYTKDSLGYASATLNDGSGNPQSVPMPDSNGTLDFYTSTYTANGKRQILRQIRWYGFPRALNPIAPTSSGGAVSLNPNNGDVLPLRDVLGYLTQSPPKITSFPQPVAPTTWTNGVIGQYDNAERFSSNFPPMAPTSAAGVPSYWDTSAGMIPSVDANPATRYTYTAAWGPDTTMPFPKMIRVTIYLDDHEGRLNTPQAYEYVFNVGS